MTKKKWLILIFLAIPPVILGTAAMLIGGYVVFSHFSVDRSLPVFVHDQIASTHPGYRRSTITSPTAVYVNDFEEYALRLAYPEPTNDIGRSSFGNAKICEVPGQATSAYVAADVGSEMPAYAVYRHSDHVPFDWRTATYQEMAFTFPNGSGGNNDTHDSAMIDDVLQTLKSGTPTSPPAPIPGLSPNLAELHLLSDQIPGLMYCPAVYLDEAGPVYLAENMAVEYTNSQSWIKASWILASPAFANWVKTP